MIRYPAFDPPEYLDWRPEADVVDQFRNTLSSNSERKAIVDSLGAQELVGLYEGLVRNRLHDIALKRWVKQGVISKAWLGTGEEATTIGAVHALNRTTAADGLSCPFIAPMIRNAGRAPAMGGPPARPLRRSS